MAYNGSGVRCDSRQRLDLPVSMLLETEQLSVVGASRASMRDLRRSPPQLEIMSMQQLPQLASPVRSSGTRSLPMLSVHCC
jgi:hypothetical protein